MKRLALLAVAALLVLPAAAYANGRRPPPIPAGTCYLSVPANPLTARGLATPWVLSGNAAVSGDPSGCTEPDPDTGAFVQAAILSPAGVPAEYDPLVITQGTKPAVAPVVPVIVPGSPVAIHVGFDNINVQLTGPGASSMVNGLPGSNFGQMAYSRSAPAFFQAADRAIRAHRLTVPPLGKEPNGTACPTIASYQVGDQDAEDNVPDLYLTDGTLVAQDTATNRVLFPADTVLANGSDNLLLDRFIDPALDTAGGTCTPWNVPSLDDPGSLEPTLAYDQIQALYEQTNPLTIQLSDEMVLAGPTTVNGVSYVGVHESIWKDDLYRIGVDSPLRLNPSEKTFCLGLASVFPPFLTANAATFAASPSPDGSDLGSFLLARFRGTWAESLPAVGIVPSCSAVTGMPDPEGP